MAATAAAVIPGAAWSEMASWVRPAVDSVTKPPSVPTFNRPARDASAMPVSAPVRVLRPRGPESDSGSRRCSMPSAVAAGPEGEGRLAATGTAATAPIRATITAAIANRAG